MFRALLSVRLDQLARSVKPASVCVCLAILLFSSAETKAWGIVGHRIVCELAYDLLGPETRDAVDALVALFVKPNGKKFKHFEDSCHFADTARHNARDGKREWQSYARFDHWHYVNLSRGAQKLTADALQCGRDCVLHAIDTHTRVLAEKSTAAKNRAEALILLAHWVADIHQPMHVSFADDRGGSDISIDPKWGLGRHLHAAWDAGIIKKHRGKKRLRKYIDDQRVLVFKERDKWRMQTSPIAWAAESYAIVTSPHANYCRWREVRDSQNHTQGRCERIVGNGAFDQSYVRRIAPILEQRLRQAAVRLAHLLEIKLNAN